MSAPVGGMAFFLAEQADVEVLGITLSEDQHASATQRARSAASGDGFI
jgi:cyclopropane fatty-acyl-phospholipid synthase-like methyltransferase